MTDRIASDNDAVSTHRVRVAAVGRTGRLRIELAEDVDVAAGDVVWCSLEGDSGFARIDETLDGTPTIDRVAPNRRQAREGDGPDRLETWLETAGIEASDALHCDVLTEGQAYGLRRAGTRVVYEPPGARDSSLADIARSLDEES